MRHRRIRHLVGILGVIVVATASDVGAAVDLAGKWYRQDSGITTIAQSGNVVTIAGMSGTVTASGYFTISASSMCTTQGRMRLLPGEDVIDGHTETYCGFGPPQVGSRLLLTRCECDDGNAADGDGCSAQCRIEPCFTCTGTPSVCTPLAGGASCDDHRTCTTGETCSFGFCTGGTAVPGCVDVNGWWRFDETITEPGFEGTRVHSGYLEERDGVVMLRQLSQVSWVGTIDPATGDLAFTIPSQSVSCSFDGISGVVGPAGFEGTGWLSVTSGFVGCAPFSTAVVGYRCGNGVVDPGETCDDGNDVSGDGCTAITCQMEKCWLCFGAPSVCSLANGFACNDGNVCTTGDVCSAGTCAGSPVDCGSCFACTQALGCQPTPRTDCRVSEKPEKSSLQILDRDPGTKDLLRWKWTAGGATSLADLGTPTTTSDVALCVFDTSGPLPTVKFRATAPAGAQCGGRPCWKAKGTGYGYKDGAAAGDGILGLTMKSGVAGKASMQLKGKGPALSGRPFGLPTLPLSTPLRVQLQVEGGACFETRIGAAGVQQNVPGTFKAYGTN